MGLDINLFRVEKGGDPELIRESQRRRFASVEVVDEIIALDNEWKKLTHDINMMNKEQNDISKEVKKLMQDAKKKGASGDCRAEAQALREKVPALKKQAKEAEERLKQVNAELRKKISTVGNIVHESVPVSKDEANNELVREWGQFTQKEEAKRHHHELLWMIDGYDPDRGVKVAGHRAYFLRGPGVRLNLALISYGIDFLSAKRGYTALTTPLFMNKAMMARTAQLSQFDEELYKVSEGSATAEDKYLIATSEQPISAYHAKEWLDTNDLPLRYCGTSSCFRKEAGSHGKDTWGIFRVHQFDKVEQFCITVPEKSWEEHEQMLRYSEEFYQSLEIPYRVVTIVSGELNNAAAKKYDLEGWFPGYNTFRELVSCSNCTDYQSRSLKISCGINQQQQGQERRFVHMLNSTLCATTRTICAILENYQTPDGVRVPDVLKPYMGGIEFIPFVKEAPVVPLELQLQEQQQQQQPQQKQKQKQKQPVTST